MRTATPALFRTCLLACVLSSPQAASQAAPAAAPPETADVKAAFGAVLKTYTPATRQISLRFEFESEDELGFFDNRELELAGGSAAWEKGSLRLEHDGGRRGPHFAAFMLRGLQFERIQQLRMVCQDVDVAKAAPGLAFCVSDDGEKGYRGSVLAGSGTLLLTRMSGPKDHDEIDKKTGKVEPGDQLELSARFGDGKMSIVAKGKKTKQRQVEAADTAFKSGRVGAVVVVQSKNALRVDAVEIQGVVTAASLQSVIDERKAAADGAKNETDPKAGTRPDAGKEPAKDPGEDGVEPG